MPDGDVRRVDHAFRRDTDRGAIPDVLDPLELRDDRKELGRFRGPHYSHRSLLQRSSHLPRAGDEGNVSKARAPSRPCIDNLAGNSLPVSIGPRRKPPVYFSPRGSIDLPR